MNIGPKHPSGGGGRNRRRRGRRPPSNRPGQGGHGGHRGHGGSHQRNARTGGGIYTAPMDHAYRAALNGENGKGGRRPGYLPPANEVEPLPQEHANGAPRIFAFIDDLFFLAKIQEVARKLNVKVEFLKSDKDLTDRLEQSGEEKPSLIIFDLNNVSAKPLSVIPKLKAKLKRGTSIIGFLSHLQGELKLKAQEAGCDMVLPRSAFSQNLPQLLRRHGAPEEAQGLD